MTPKAAKAVATLLQRKVPDKHRGIRRRNYWCRGGRATDKPKITNRVAYGGIGSGQSDIVGESTGCGSAHR